MGKAGWINANLRTTFGKILRRAGLEPWPRLFHNLRASRETELVEKYPVQVVTSWLGNTPSVALRHYLMTTDDHFAAAVKGETNAAQNAAQHAHVSGSSKSQSDSTAQQKTPVLPGFVSGCDDMRTTQMAGTGIELPLVFNGKTYILAIAGDAGGIISSKRVLSNRLNRSEN